MVCKVGFAGHAGNPFHQLQLCQVRALEIATPTEHPKDDKCYAEAGGLPTAKDAPLAASRTLDSSEHPRTVHDRSPSGAKAGYLERQDPQSLLVVPCAEGEGRERNNSSGF